MFIHTVVEFFPEQWAHPQSEADHSFGIWGWDGICGYMWRETVVGFSLASESIYLFTCPSSTYLSLDTMTLLKVDRIIHAVRFKFE